MPTLRRSGCAFRSFVPTRANPCRTCPHPHVGEVAVIGRAVQDVRMSAVPKGVRPWTFRKMVPGEEEPDVVVVAAAAGGRSEAAKEGHRKDSPTIGLHRGFRSSMKPYQSSAVVADMKKAPELMPVEQVPVAVVEQRGQTDCLLFLQVTVVVVVAAAAERRTNNLPKTKHTDLIDSDSLLRPSIVLLVRTVPRTARSCAAAAAEGVAESSYQMDSRPPVAWHRNDQPDSVEADPPWDRMDFPFAEAFVAVVVVVVVAAAAAAAAAAVVAADNSR